MKKTEISRRSFLGMSTTAAVLAGMSMVGCAPKAQEEASEYIQTAGASTQDTEWTHEVDVVVIGFGGAGAAAAIEANKAGAEVAILELTKDGGGSTVANGGFIMMGGTALQEKFNIEDSVDNFYNYLAAAAGENANKEAIRLMCDSSPDLYEWCVECGMDFESGVCDNEHHLGGYNAGTSLGYSGNEMAQEFSAVATPAPRGHMPQPSSSGQDMFGPLKAVVEDAGIEVFYETPGSYLLTDESGRIAGVAGAGKQGEILVKARKGVVLTCGGFVDNEDMLDAFYPYANKRGDIFTSAGNEDGSGILMGMAVGAATFGMGNFQIGRTIVTASEPLAQGILVDSIGHRIVAEDEYNSFIGKAIIQAQNSLCFLIIDEATFSEADLSYFGEPLVTVNALNEIGTAIGVDSDVLGSTLAFYNESANMGLDREFGKNPKFLKPLEEGPFHVFYSGSEACYTASCGGLKIDLEARVLNQNNEVIPGLYSAGRNSGTIYGWYMGSGSSMADVLTFGRIAGKNAAEGNVE